METKREILFRGKRKYTKEWVEGDLTGGDTIHVQPPWTDHESYEWWGHEVIPETIGQFTGWKDLNQNSLFEGDIIEDENGDLRMVVFGGTGWEMRTMKGEIPADNVVFKFRFTIVGNIHDNPELLKH